jgi:hypothetical protein
MTRFIWAVAAGVLLGGVACANVVAIKMPSKDPSTQGYYTCVPNGHEFKCDSGQSLHQYDLRLEPSEQKCENGIYEVHVKTNWHGGISQVQYQCAVASSIGGFPAVVSSAAATAAGGQPGSH